MLEKKDHVKRIQEITFEAYKSSGRIAALLDQNTGPSEQLSEELERVAAQIEHGAIELRNLCARYQAPLPPVGQKPALEPLNIAGRAECNEFGWLHIQLNALLPNCRFASPLWITDTITRLLDRLERRNGKLPLLEEALLMIDEHCDIAARQVYDQDNKAWKAISRAGSSLTMTSTAWGYACCPDARRKRSATSMCSLFRTRETFSSCAPTNTPFPVDLRLHRTARRAYNIGYSGGQIPALARYIQHTILDRTIGASHSRM